MLEETLNRIRYHAQCMENQRQRYLKDHREEMQKVALSGYQYHMNWIAYLINPELFPNVSKGR